MAIKVINSPEWGVAVEYEVKFGVVTPQNRLLDMGDEINGDIITHFPGGMSVCDLREEEVIHPN